MTTLLDLGADVTVLTIGTHQDFFLGLEHPRLHVEFLEAKSLYIRYVEYSRRRSLAKTERSRRRVADGHSRIRLMLLAPVYLLGGLALALRRGSRRIDAAGGILIRRAAEPLTRLARIVDSPTRGIRRRSRTLHTAARLLARRTAEHLASATRTAGRRLPAGLRRRRWALARWLVRARRVSRLRWARFRMRLRRGAKKAAAADVTRDRWRWVRAGRRQISRMRLRLLKGRYVPRARRRVRRRHILIRRVLRRRRVTTRRALLNMRLRNRRRFVAWAKRRLLPVHRITRFAAFWRESARRLEELRPDLVVSSDLPGLVGASIGAQRVGRPHLHDCHELYLESTSFRGFERRLLRPVEDHYLRRADAVVAVTGTIAGEYQKRCGVLPVVVRNCAWRVMDDLPCRDLREQAGLPRSSRVVLYQGGFAPGRGLDVCVAAMAEVPPDVHLIFLGYGPLADDLQTWARERGVGERVHVLAAVPPEELASWTASATVGLIPYQPVSRNNLFALPNKAFEYTGAGVPLVASDLPELRRIAVDHGCGEVYDAFDHRSLARALSAVLHTERYPGYRRAARLFGRENVWETEREILIGEVRRLLPAFNGRSMENAARAVTPDAPSSSAAGA